MASSSPTSRSAALGMQASRRAGFGFLQGAPGPWFWRQQKPTPGRCPPVKGRARALSLPGPLHLIWGREAASVGGRRDLTLGPSQAAGGDGHRPGGSSGDDRRVAYTKCIRSDFDSSGLHRGPGGGVDSPPPAFRPATNEWEEGRGPSSCRGLRSPSSRCWAPWDRTAGSPRRPRRSTLGRPGGRMRRLMECSRSG